MTTLGTVPAAGVGGRTPRAPAGAMHILSGFRGYARPHIWILLAGVGCRVGELLADLAQPWALAVVIDSVAGSKPLSGGLEWALGPFAGSRTALLTAIVVASVVLVVVSAGFDYLGDRTMNGAGERMTAAIRRDVFAHMHRLPLAYHDRQSVGELSSRVAADTDRIEDALVDVFSTVIPGVLSFAGLVAIMLATDWRLGLIGVMSSPILAITIVRYARLTREAARTRRAWEGRLTGSVAETLVGIRTVHAMGRHDLQDRRFADANQRTLSAGLRAVDVRARFTPLVEVGAALGAAALLWVGAYGVIVGSWSLGILVVEISYSTSLLKPIRSLSGLSLTLSTGAASAERVRDILDQPVHAVATADPPRALPHRARAAVEFRRVSFAYEHQQVLRNVSLRIMPGERLALVGPNGSGKSTLLSLLARLYDPDTGDVLLDGHPIRTVPLEWLRAQLAVVLQDTFLFSGSIWENIAFGRPSATPDEITIAAQRALVDQFTQALPDGMHTLLGDRGVGLSGGQRQRVAIARALLRDAPIVLLDEPTSALDLQAEAVVIEALQPLMQGRTVLMATHRPALLELATRTVQISDGSVRTPVPAVTVPSVTTTPAPGHVSEAAAVSAAERPRRPSLRGLDRPRHPIRLRPASTVGPAHGHAVVNGTSPRKGLTPTPAPTPLSGERRRHYHVPSTEDAPCVATMERRFARARKEPAMTHILLIEDDARIREIVERGLGTRGVVVSSASEPDSGLELASKLDVDLVLLDLVLPRKGGLELLQELRAAKPHLPVIALTALGDTRSKVEGLESGVDDYVTKPFAIDELVARIRARLRWRDVETSVLKAGPLTVDLVAHRVIVNEREVTISARELSLLAAFVRHTGQTLSRTQLLQLVWEMDFDPGSNVVDVYVAALRRKIGAAFIETVRGCGYRFVVPQSATLEGAGT